jgi:hypothetical protein
MTDRPRYVLVIEAGPDPLTRRGYPPRPAEARLRGVLKGLVRAAGFKVVDCYPHPPPAAPAVAGGTIGDPDAGGTGPDG